MPTACLILLWQRNRPVEMYNLRVEIYTWRVEIFISMAAMYSLKMEIYSWRVEKYNMKFFYQPTAP